MSTDPASARPLPGRQHRNGGGAAALRRPFVVVEEPAPAGSVRGTLGEHGPPTALDKAWRTAVRAPARPPAAVPLGFGAMIGASPPMREVFAQIERVAPTDVSVLVLGESGTGKELVAEAIHGISRRRDKPMIAVNCGAIPAPLIESELFGHERGSFTGAACTHRGHFERADGGTLFLDEVNEMPYELQVKLLRVLESGSFHRVGGDRLLSASVRVIAASKPNLERAAAEGRFRTDLLYRLKVFPIALPPLREREGDLALLTEHFLGELNRDAEVEKQVTPAARALLLAHDWPGNVRELKHLLERAYILSDAEIGAEAMTGLRCRDAGAARAAGGPRPGVLLSPGMSLSDAERLFVLATLESAAGDRAKAAAMLAISTSALGHRLRRYRARSDPGSRLRGTPAGARGQN